VRDRGPRPAARDRAPAPEERSLTQPEPSFVGSFPRADIALDPPLPELALIGRSNVGKSSLLNALAGRRIAKVSRTPGKTRALNVFHMPVVTPVGAQHAAPLPHASFYLLDLPGYGYAKAGKTDRAAFGRILQHVLDRERLAGVVWLFDVRRDPSDDDRAMQDRLAAHGTRVLAAITKRDKLPRGQGLRREQAIRAAIGFEPEQLVATSARTGEGVAELLEAIGALVRRER
jgi:GTP-binding protein